MYHIKQELILEVQQVPPLLQIPHFLSLAHKFLHVLPLQDQKKGPAPHGLTLMLFEDSKNRVSVVYVLRYVGIMWLIAHLFQWPMARFIVKNGHREDTLYDEIGLCSQNIDSVILGSIVTAHMGGVTSSLKRNIITTST